MSQDTLLAWQNGTYRFKTPPLKRCKITQPFGVDYVGGGFYKRMGMDGHNGLDFSAPTGTEIIAPDDGFVEEIGSINDGGYGLNTRQYVYLADNFRLAFVSAHLKSVVKTGEVKAGDVIALSNNSGASTGPHLHFGVRLEYLSRNGWEAYKGKNGYFGYDDPQPLFPDQDVFKLPVELCYGLTPNNPLIPTEFGWYKTNAWFLSTFKRLMTPLERNALRFGFWDVRTVLDPAMFYIWSEMTKPEAIKRGLIK